MFYLEVCQADVTTYIYKYIDSTAFVSSRIEPSLLSHQELRAGAESAPVNCHLPLAMQNQFVGPDSFMLILESTIFLSGFNSAGPIAYGVCTTGLLPVPAAKLIDKRP